MRINHTNYKYNTTLMDNCTFFCPNGNNNNSVSDWLERKLIFLHIPKTGGSSLRHLINRNYAAEKIYSLQGTRQAMIDFMNLPEDQINGYDCVLGHMGFGFHRYFSSKAGYITLLRSPVSRLISLYTYILNTPEHYLHNLLITKGMTFDDFVRSEVTHELYNGQTRLLASENGLGITFYDKKIMNSDDLELAKRHLDRYFIAGILERFDDFLRVLKYLLCWKDISYQKKNVGLYKIDPGRIPDETIEIINKNNDIDFQLYNYVLEVFNYRLKSLELI